MTYRLFMTVAAFLVITTSGQLPAFSQTPVFASPPTAPLASPASVQDPMERGRQLLVGNPTGQGNLLRVPDYVGARAAFEQALAQPGVSVEAQLALAKMLLNGQGGQVDQARAITLLQSAVQSGNGAAAFVLGTELLNSADRQDEAVSMLEAALRFGYAQAGLVLADRLRASDAEQSASLRDLSIKTLQQYAAAGDSSAASALGDFYRSQAAAPQWSDALKWYQRAFELGNERALYWIANLHAEKASPFADPAEAVKLYDQAAMRGSSLAARDLIAAASAGTLPVDSSRATFWTKQLLAIGDVEAKVLDADQRRITLDERQAMSDQIYAGLMGDPVPDLDVLLDTGLRFRDGRGLIANVERALALFERGFARGDKVATLRYARLLLAWPTLQTPRNTAQAYEAVKSLVASGNDNGAQVLGEMLANGIGTKADPEQAIKFYQLSADRTGSVAAMMGLADVYRASSDQTTRLMALPWIEKAASADSVSALMTLAQIYVAGDIVPRDRLKAVDLYQQAIDLGAGDALDALADLYVKTGGQDAVELADNVFERAIRQDYPDAAIKYANFLNKTGRAQLAISMLERPEFSTRVDVALALAQLYTSGQSGFANPDKAQHWLQVAFDEVGSDTRQRLAVAHGMLTSNDAASQVKAVAMLEPLFAANIPEAARYLGLAYLSGRGVPAVDIEKGVANYQIAISLGDLNARIELADFYAKGLYVPLDAVRAVSFYQDALDQSPDNAVANLRLGSVYADGLLGKRDWSTAFKYYLRAAEAGNATAQQAIGTAYLWGAGVAADAALANKWLQLASDAGSVEATASLATLHSAAVGSAVNASSAFAYNYQAAEKGYAPAMLEVGIALTSGFGVTADRESGIGWLEKAASLGSTEAMFNLYFAYAHGIGVQQNETEANNWLNRAISAGDGAAMYQLGVDLLATKLPADHDKAVALFLQAAAVGHHQSKKFLASMGLASAADLEIDAEDE